jgi:hypothetical protein
MCQLIAISAPTSWLIFTKIMSACPHSPRLTRHRQGMSKRVPGCCCAEAGPHPTTDAPVHSLVSLEAINSALQYGPTVLYESFGTESQLRSSQRAKGHAGPCRVYQRI